MRPVHTYSIVAHDLSTGQLGVAVQSHWFSVGTVVPWAESGVGAVATQSFAEPSYGSLGLALMRGGKPAPLALKALLSVDADRDLRQVAMIDAHGHVAVHTGKKCIAEAGHQVGEGFSVQANMMAEPSVWPAMAKAFTKATGDLADRLLAALLAAQNEGGDIRGQQSAALLVVQGKPTGQPYTDRFIDLRVEDATDPLTQLARLLNLRRAYHFMDQGDAHIAVEEWEQARKAYEQAASLAPHIMEMPFWHAVALAAVDRLDEALPIFKAVFAKEPGWRRLVSRLTRSGQLPNDPELVDRIVAIGK